MSGILTGVLVLLGAGWLAYLRAALWREQLWREGGDAMALACEALQLPSPEPHPQTGMLWWGWRARIQCRSQHAGQRTILRLRPHQGQTLLEIRRGRRLAGARLNLSVATDSQLEAWIAEQDQERIPSARE